MLAYDLGGVCGGVSRRVKFRPVPGTITCADYPAPVSGAGVCNMPMVVADRDRRDGQDGRLRRSAPARQGHRHRRRPCVRRVDLQRHQPARAVLHGHAFRHGTRRHPRLPGPRRHRHRRASTGCRAWRPRTSRTTRCRGRCSPSSGGRTGPTRPAPAATAAESPPRRPGSSTAPTALDTQVYNNESFAKCQGLLGGNPGRPGLLPGQAGHRRRGAARRRHHPPEPGRRRRARRCRSTGRACPSSSTQTSVWTLNLPNFAGYGDPLDRDPAAVSRDLSEGKMAAEDAFGVYGVVRRRAMGRDRRRGDQGGTGGAQEAAAGRQPARRAKSRGQRRAARRFGAPA